ncbi:MAG: hypothetical protein ACR2P8_02170 [Myxococcota bacterium]
MKADRGRALRLSTVAGLAGLVLSGGALAEPEVLAGSASEAILVLPLNVVTQMPEQLAQASPIVWEDLTGYLQDRGRKLKTARMSDARHLWRESIRAVREQGEASAGDFDAALAELARALAGHAGFATVVVPSLLLREAAVRNRRAEWDETSESVDFRADTPDARKLALLTRFEGLAPAASLHLVALDPEGRKVHEALRGLELIAAVRIVEDPQEPFVYEYQRDLFQDHASIRAAIAQALVPLVPLADSAGDSAGE